MNSRFVAILALAFVAFAAAGQENNAGNAKTFGSCSPATSGNKNIYYISCKIDAAHGKQMVEILNKILAKGLDSTKVLDKLDELSKDNSILLSYGSPTHGELLPGTQEDPPITDPNCHPRADALKIFMGNSVAFINGGSVTALQTKTTKDFVSITKTEKGIFVNATVTSFPDGKIIAKIQNNEFVANSNNTLERKVSPDHTTLEVTDEYGQSALRVQVLNAYSIRITGRFSSSLGPIIIDDNKMTVAGRTFAVSCSDNNLVGFLIN